MKAKQAIPEDLLATELEFLSMQRLSVDDVLDVRGPFSQIGRKRALEHYKKSIGLTDVRCSRGHRLRTRAGHCVQCNPATLAYEKRHRQTAFVYVCQSETGLIKIGFSSEVSQRAASLSRDAYASCKNWRLVFQVSTRMAGKVETDAHRFLKIYKTSEVYVKEGREVTTYEAFVCSVDQAITAVKTALERNMT
jgi:hypothetical protein